ncbi:hypothetical protein [Nostoc sp. NMS8]|nr:hypothetical protein [Nostoc sp. NMS8]MBN3959294.1 hypothetical protein [Nostoc sp. NMS8]
MSLVPPPSEILWRTSKSLKYLVLTLQPQVAIACLIPILSEKLYLT